MTRAHTRARSIVGHSLKANRAPSKTVWVTSSLETHCKKLSMHVCVSVTIYSRGMKTSVCTKIWRQMFVADLLTIVDMKTPPVSVRDEWNTVRCSAQGSVT